MDLDALVRQVSGHWAARSVGAGAVATVVDVLVLLAGVRLLHFPAVPAAAVAVALGSVVSFLLNKYVAFRDRLGPLAPQLARFAVTSLAAVGVHTLLMHLLVDRLHADLLASKLVGDLLVFGCGSLWAMRWLVFPEHAGDRRP